MGIYLSILHLCRKGSFVIAIQGKDVSNSNTQILEELMKIQREMCHLLIRPRKQPKYETLYQNLDNQTNAALDKTTFHVFMRINESSPAFDCGFRDFDEVLEVRRYFVVLEITYFPYEGRIFVYIIKSS